MVATPIGNLDDVGLRALSVLSGAALIAAEDTRTTSVLLDRHKIRARLVSLHEHNERRAAEGILDALREGNDVALVSDAGTPAISDPGSALVARAREEGFRVTPIPGPNAAVAAMSVAGMPETGFLFYGFLPAKPEARRHAIEALRPLPWPLVFYEAPHRILECIEDLAGTLGGERDVVIARELTKMFEQIHRCRLDEARAWLSADANRVKGEFVLVVAGAKKSGSPDAAETDRVLGIVLDELPLAQAVKITCAITGAKRNLVYARALELAGQEK